MKDGRGNLEVAIGIEQFARMQDAVAVKANIELTETHVDTASEDMP
jgi:hypothetical protein